MDIIHLARVPDDVDLDAVAVDLADDGVAGPADILDVLHTIHDDGQAQGIDNLSVAVVDSWPNIYDGEFLADVSRALLAEQGGEGTVVVTNYRDIVVESSQYSHWQISQAAQDFHDQPDYLAGTHTVVANLAQSQPLPWGGLALAVVLLMIIVVAVTVASLRWLNGRHV